MIMMMSWFSCIFLRSRASLVDVISVIDRQTTDIATSIDDDDDDDDDDDEDDDDDDDRCTCTGVDVAQKCVSNTIVKLL